jgi:hypothetical protein
MPLRSLGLPPDSDCWFWMEDASSGRRVQVEVSRAALDGARHLAAESGKPYVSPLDAFNGRRPEIEEIASKKYDAGLLTRRGLVEVTDRDLNPELYEKR